ncbi:MAG: YabP/YqfC family sporulation protein [Lachnospiraceae bacterium]|nr:YabP/YqfC family sporulation protein [Lachnospiraceae bacterium]MCD7764990.1 YabP/YqfC family sporulation protein [Lachnospiraceae bacterium]
MSGRPDDLFQKNSWAQSLQIPGDCLRGRALVTMMGRDHICIENFKGICSYTPETVRLTVLGGRICVSGQRLRIDSYTKDEITITGRIAKVEYE